MYKTQSFKKKMLVTAVAMAGASLPAFAQEASEEIVVTGIRASLERAVDVKRESKGVVDAISAEDIGKFPDTNLAESLQRIPGVSIDRNNGEGSRITVRGFGADRNLVTLNGRQLPTTTGGRAFEFSNMASEAVSGVQVYKTSDATVTSGGMGATVNLSTHKPLNKAGLQAVVSGKLVEDQSAEDGDTTPEFGGLISNTFLDDTLGVSLSGSYQERESGVQEFLQDQGYRGHPASYTGWGGAPAAPDGGATRPTAGNYSVPQQPRYIFEERQRERMNGQLVVQWQPMDTLTITGDYTYINNTYETQHYDVSAWFNFSDDRNESVWAGNDLDGYYPTIYSEIYPEATRDTSLTVGSYGSEEEIGSLGLNAKWQATDSLTLELDYHNSEGNATPTDAKHGSRNNLQLPSYTRGRTALDLTGSLPGIAIGSTDLESFNPSTMQLSGSWFQSHRYTSEVEELQAKGNFEFNENSNIDFGLALNSTANHFRFVSVERPDWGGIGAPGDFDDFNWREDTVLDKFQGSANDTGIDGYVLLDRIWLADIDDIFAAADAADDVFYTTSMIQGDCAPAAGGVAGPGPKRGGQFCASTDYDRGTNRFTEEETQAMYVQWNNTGEITGKSYDLHLGLRYEATDVTSWSQAPSYTQVLWAEATQASLDGATDSVRTTESGDYSKVLPNLNFNLDVAEDFKLRTALSKTISRAPFNDLQGGIIVSTGGNRSSFNGTAGNPDLKPLESTNIDMSVEWYYDDASYASVGYFRKKVSNWTSTEPDASEVYSPALPNPMNGAKFDAALAALGSSASNEAIRGWIFANYLNDPKVRPNLLTANPNDGVIEGDSATDRPIVFGVTVPVNSDVERTVSGLEFTVQQMFGESGFGATANYTLVDADISYDNRSLSDTPALVGLSDTANLVLFYDNYGVQARVAYNWRDEFLSERRVNGNLTAGIYTEAYSQIDLTLSYDLPMVEGLTVFVEGINVTDEYVETHGRLSALTYRITETGPRYNIGARYSF